MTGRALRKRTSGTGARFLALRSDKRSGTFDVSACPGSGKTTLVVAKLAIMARKWPHRTSGICVLSHTNVAREEIQSRLGHTPVGHRLLGFPHFIDTIHTFANRFLALPYLQSNGYPSPLIDDDVAKAFRWNHLKGKERSGLEYYLQKNDLGIDAVTFASTDLSPVVFHRGKIKPFPSGPNSDSYKKAHRIIKTSAEAGRFRYEEMFVWAEHLLQTYPDISATLSHRFPLVLMDEMQDTSLRQAALLHSIFNRGAAVSGIQRVGDPNQEIFETGQDQNTADPFPDKVEDRTMTIASSRRFGKPIADLANPHAVIPIGDGGLRGNGPGKAPDQVDHGQNLIIIFPDNDCSKVLEAFGAHLLQTFDDDTLAFGDCFAIGGVHRPTTENIPPGHNKYPRSVEHYWADYSAENAKMDRHPKTLSGYLHQAQEIVRSGHEIGPAVNGFAAGMQRLVRNIGRPNAELESRRKHKAIRTVLEGTPDLLTQYDEFARSYITKISPITADLWAEQKGLLLTIAASLCEGTSDTGLCADFMAWEEPPILPQLQNDGVEKPDNTCVITADDRHVSIRLGSIHQAKGQTHFATLLLSTFQNHHSSEKIVDWLCGDKSSGAGEGPQNLSRLKGTYVALTRPTHLVGVAVRHSAIVENEHAILGKLQAQGWHVTNLCV
ncbi:AAA domain-containing protein [Yoonia maritima]|uniref:AAA domain-containing protein n=1 Tax=Yoonia maritima TaxID=1435347 RepID=A0A2T0W599_9RHOB|nr:AAA domain-containing protein [Yoonia maritima]